MSCSTIFGKRTSVESRELEVQERRDRIDCTKASQAKRIPAHSGTAGHRGPQDSCGECSQEISGPRQFEAGGGIAEILFRLTPLMNELGLDAKWEVIKGDQAFFEATKTFHNDLQTGMKISKPRNIEEFEKKTAENLRDILIDGDTIFIHDPQPVGMIAQRKTNSDQKWIWRCHLDVSNPDADVWTFLSRYVRKYDASVFSSPAFARSDLGIPQLMVPPSIDPLVDKNRELPQTFIDRVLSKYGLNSERPIISQISRFDYAKDTIGVIEAFKLVSKHIDCELVLGGSLADDNPEGLEALCQSPRSFQGKERHSHSLDSFL